MRKKTISNLADTIFWYLLYSLPIIMYIVSAFHHNTVDFTSFLTDQLGFVFTADNPVFTVISDLFGSAGTLPLFANDSFSYIVTWFVCVFLVHLAVDVVLFIPRFAHKMLSKVTSEG